MKGGNNAATAAQLVEALHSAEGLPNSQASLIRYDKRKAQALFNHLEAARRKLKGVARWNEAAFKYLNNWSGFAMDIWEYSLMGNPVQITVPSAMLPLRAAGGAQATATGVEELSTAYINRICRRANVERETERHSNCSNDSATKKRDLLPHVKRTLRDLHKSGRMGFLNEPARPWKIFEECGGQSWSSRRAWSQGWARRPSRGETYGKNSVKRYRVDIEDMFDRGARDLGCKMSAAAMLEELKQKRPSECDLPSESEIKKEITLIYGQRKKQIASQQSEKKSGRQNARER